MLTDRGVGPQLAASALEPRWFDDCTWLHLPAYSLVAAPVAGAAIAAAAMAPRLSVDLSSTAALRAYGIGRFRALLGRRRPRGRLSARRDTPRPAGGGQGRGENGSDAVTIQQQVAPEVAEALRFGRPVVALETTL